MTEPSVLTKGDHGVGTGSEAGVGADIGAAVCGTAGLLSGLDKMAILGVGTVVSS